MLPNQPHSQSFYNRPVVEVARDLVGCVVAYERLSGVIVETEAYHHSEPACHAFVGLTPRTKTLFGPAGHAYVYRSYGVHALLNAVAEAEGVGAGVLIRAIEPLEGATEMKRRRKMKRLTDIGSGPGKLTQALGIGLELNGTSLKEGPIKIYPRSADWANVNLIAGTRIGITRAVELPWRFCAEDSRHLSRPHPVSTTASNRRDHEDQLRSKNNGRSTRIPISSQ